MKNIKILFMLVTCLFVVADASAANKCREFTYDEKDADPCETTLPGYEDDEAEGKFTYLGSWRNMKGDHCWHVISAVSCLYGMSMVPQRIEECDIEYNSCECVCDESCKDDAGWTPIGKGTEYSVSRSCVCEAGTGARCVEYTEYRCAANYYDAGGLSGCQPCPDGGKSPAGSTKVTACCLDANVALEDLTGSYKYSSACCYTK